MVCSRGADSKLETNWLLFFPSLMYVQSHTEASQVTCGSYGRGNDVINVKS